MIRVSFVIRKFQETDAQQIATLFHDTVHSVNVRDYSKEQVDAWAPRVSGSEQQARVARFNKSLGACISYVADQEGVILGFADLSEQGYLDFLYVHKDYQRQGVASALLNLLEGEAHQRGLKQIWANVSITAKPFFEGHGYGMIQPQTVKVGGVSMQNFKMAKVFKDDTTRGRDG